jgi:hypothetical protein
MKIEKQCCSFDLSVKLNELGITQHSNFYWKQNEIQTVVTERQMKEWIEKYLPICNDYYSAFTVAELGMMITDTIIGSSFWLRNFHSMNIQLLNGNMKHDFKAETEADCRAKCLIFLIEQRFVKLEDVNNSVLS